jgi:hypothetical protein
MARRVARWPEKYPGSLLPRGGVHPFVPPKQTDWPRNKARGPRDGYIDRDGNIWIPHPPPATGRPEDFHWDVEHSDGRHTNVAPDGSIHHGPDNFA